MDDPCFVMSVGSMTANRGVTISRNYARGRIEVQVPWRVVVKDEGDPTSKVYVDQQLGCTVRDVVDTIVESAEGVIWADIYVIMESRRTRLDTEIDELGHMAIMRLYARM